VEEGIAKGQRSDSECDEGESRESARTAGEGAGDKQRRDDDVSQDDAQPDHPAKLALLPLSPATDRGRRLDQAREVKRRWIAMAESGDAESLFRQAEALFARAVKLEAEACERRGQSAAHSLAALHRLVELAVAAGHYPRAQHLLSSVPSDYRDVPPEQWVSVAPGVLGPGVSLEGDDEKDVPGAGTFSVITPHVFRAVAALERVAPRLMEVDEHGNVLAPLKEGEPPGDEVYTPSYVSDVETYPYGAVVGLDTDGVMFSAMGRTLVGILKDALAADAIPAHITGYRPDFHIWP
jgi:hypothetical protein